MGMESSKIDGYLNNNFRGDTKRQYKSHLNLFFEFLKLEPDTYFDNDRNYEEDVKKYWQYLMTKYAPKSIPPKLSTIKYFLEEHNIEFKNRFWKQLSKRGLGNATVREDRIPTQSQLKQIVTLAKAKDRAFFLMMASSGLRVGELINLKVSDVDASSTPVKIRVPGTITRNKKSRITFITGEAFNALEAWLKIRDKYVDQNARRFVGLKGYLTKTLEREISYGDDGRIFPYSEVPVRERWNKILDTLGEDFAVKDTKTGAYKLHLYTLRKYFNTRLKKVIPEFVVEKLMGHEGYLNGSYDRFTEEELADWYVKGQSQLYILEAPANQEDVENVKEQMERLQSQVTELLKQTAWYRQNAMMTVQEDEGKVAVPIYNDKEALKQYEQEKKTIEEIKEKSPEIWAEEQRKKIKAKQWKKKVQEQ